MSDVQPHPYYRALCRATCAVLFIFAVGYGHSCVKNGWAVPPPVNSKAEKLGNDFTAFYSAGEQARLGRNIYDWASTSMPHRPYEYPPLFAVFPMLPLSFLPFNAALAAFYAMNALLLAASFVMLRRLLWPPLSSYRTGAPLWELPLAGLLLTLALSWRFIHSNTNESNANLVPLFLLTLALYADRHWVVNDRESPRGELACGLAVAMATAVKLTPGLFGLYFLWSRRAWSMLGGAIGLALFLFVVPGLFLGWNTNLKYLDAYTHFALGKSIGAESSDSESNERIVIGRPRALDPNESSIPQGVGVSFRGVLTNLLTLNPVLKATPDNRKRTVNFATLEPKQVGFYSNILSLILLLATVALSFGARAKSDTTTAALSWGLVTVAMTLISPLTRIAHLVVLVIPIATLVTLLQQKKISGRSKTLAVSALVLVAASGLAGEYLRAIGFTTLALLVLYAALAAVLLRINATAVSN